MVRQAADYAEAGAGIGARSNEVERSVGWNRSAGA